jgi:hypothetical protein
MREGTQSRSTRRSLVTIHRLSNGWLVIETRYHRENHETRGMRLSSHVSFVISEAVVTEMDSCREQDVEQGGVIK